MYILLSCTNLKLYTGTTHSRGSSSRRRLQEVSDDRQVEIDSLHLLGKVARELYTQLPKVVIFIVHNSNISRCFQVILSVINAPRVCANERHYCIRPETALEGLALSVLTCRSLGGPRCEVSQRRSDVSNVEHTPHQSNPSRGHRFSSLTPLVKLLLVLWTTPLATSIQRRTDSACRNSKRYQACLAGALESH